MQGRERQYNAIHDEIHEGAEQGAAPEGAGDQEGELAADQVVGRRRSKRNREMQRQSQCGKSPAAFHDPAAEQTRSDAFQHSVRRASSQYGHDRSVEDVQGSSDQPSRYDGAQRLRSSWRHFSAFFGNEPRTD